MRLQRFLLEMFTVVVETRRINAAAKLLNLTQPAVSQQIKHMEAYFGVPLLVRGSTGVAPTPAGELVYRHAKQILAQFDCLEREIDDLMNADEREVAVGATQTVGNYALPCSLWTFKERFPKANLRLEVGNCGEMAQGILDRSLHMAIMEGFVPPLLASAPGVKSRVISGDHLIFVTPAGGRWDQGSLTAESLPQAPLVLPGRTMGMREPLDRALEGHGIDQRDLRVMAQIGGLEGMKSAMETYDAVMLCTRMAVQKELKAGLYMDVTPYGWEIRVPFHLVCLEESLPPVARRFIRFIAAPEELASCWT